MSALVQKRTNADANGLSAMCQKRTSRLWFDEMKKAANWGGLWEFALLVAAYSLPSTAYLRKVAYFSPILSAA